MSVRMTRPPLSPRDVLDELRQRYGMTEVADLLGPLLADRI